jgi:hypothetical protein
MKPSIGLLAWIAGAVAFSSSSHAGIDDIPSPLRRDVRCMMQVLQKMPHVDQVESGVWNYYGLANPFVQYRYQEQDGQVGTVRFVAEERPDSKPYWWARLNGLSSGPYPPEFGAREIAKRWQLQCGVTAVASFG